jgi:hypothetical protein
MPPPGPTCFRGHPYRRGSFTWQRDGKGNAYRQCRECNSARAALRRVKSRTAKITAAVAAVQQSEWWIP